MEKEIVMDAGILLDIIVRSRPGHKFAKLIGVHLIEHGIKVKVPMPALFEIRSAMLHEKMEAREKGRAIQINEDISESTPLQYQPVAIDQAFFDKYFNPAIPALKAGDYLYVALAKGEGLIFLTEDAAQYAAAVMSGVRVYTAAEYRRTCMEPRP